MVGAGALVVVGSGPGAGARAENSNALQGNAELHSNAMHSKQCYM